MKAVGNWKVTVALPADNAEEQTVYLGIYSGHVIDIAKKLSGIKCKYLIFTPTKEDEKIDFDTSEVPEMPIVRFFMEGVKKEWLASPPDQRNAYFQSMFMKDEPLTNNWLVVQTMPYIKMEFI